MAYATVAELRRILTQVAGGATNDALLQDALDDATSIVDGELGFSFATYPDTATAKDIRAVGGEYLYLPNYEAASVSAVAIVYSRGETGETTEAVTGYLADEDVRPYRLWRAGGWPAGLWYRVTAKWGNGEAPDAIKRVVLEVAVNLWGSEGSRQISDVVGVEGGGAVGYNRAWTNRQREILANTRRQYGHLGAC